jgi:hypothetical protein
MQISYHSVAGRRRINYQPPTLSLLIYNLDLLVEYLAGEAIDRNVHPVMLLAFASKAILKTTTR